MCDGFGEVTYAVKKKKRPLLFFNAGFYCETLVIVIGAMRS